MSWINANYAILEATNTSSMQETFTGTYAGNAWNVMRRTLLNEIHISIYRVLIDNDGHVASIQNLKPYLDDQSLLRVVKSKYTQSAGTFGTRLRSLKLHMRKLDKEIKTQHSAVKALILHRHTRMAHTAAKPYTGPTKLKWGDEKILIGMLNNIVSPMEHILLNAGNISGSTKSSYTKYAKYFWAAFDARKVV